MAEDRWGRLAKDLQDAGFNVRLDRRAYAEGQFGRIQRGVSTSITYRVPGKGTVEVSDKWWRKNLNTWLGWTVEGVGTDDIVITGRTWASKQRSVTVASFRAAVTALQGRTA